MGAEWDDGTGQKIDWSLAVYVTPCSKSKELASNSPFHDHQLSFARRTKLFFGHYETTISFGEGIFFLYFNIFTLFIYYLFHHRDIEEVPSEKSLVQYCIGEISSLSVITIDQDGGSKQDRIRRTTTHIMYTK